MSFSIQIKMIKELGLSDYEAKCYLALFERESLSVIEVIDITGIPRPNAYQALKKLLAKGLCVAMPGKAKRYAAADPMILHEKAHEIVNDSLDAEIADLESKKQKILEKKKIINNNIETVVSKLQDLYKNSRGNGDPLEYMEVIKHPAQVHHRVLQLLKNAKKEMFGFTKPPYSFTSETIRKTRNNFDEQVECLNNAVKRGLIMRNIYEIPEEKDQLVNWYNDVCDGHNPAVEDRVIEKLPLKMTVFDRRFVIYQLEDPIERRPSTTSLITEHPALAEGFTAMFEYYWEKADDHLMINGRKCSLLKPSKI